MKNAQLRLAKLRYEILGDKRRTSISDENGKQQKPFGRIFYAEGKALKF